MARIITDFMDCAAKKCPEKIAFIEENREVTYIQLRDESYKVATEIIERKIRKKPIAILMDKSISCISAFLGISYSGNYYSLLDTEMPIERMKKILDVFEPELIITDIKNYDMACELKNSECVISVENVIIKDYDYTAVEHCKRSILETDVMYVLFTSGSTGIPKGVVTPHRSVVNYIIALTDAYNINEETIVGNQIPFYFVMSVLDIYGTIAKCAQTYLIPKKKFLFPGQLVKYIADHKINLLSWVPSALCLIANSNAFKAADISCVKTVIFGGEVMPIKQLKMWQNVLPKAIFINGYGSTEITDGCTYYIVNREFDDNETLPIGIPFSNTEVIVINEEGELVKDENDGIGELCIRSDSMTYGYFKDPEKTRQVYIQNPLNVCYPEIIYKMGDLVKYNEYGELEYIGRKDFQIKHMGRRIELGEIEANILAIEGVKEICCQYDNDNQQIVAFYTGTVDDEKLSVLIKEKLPAYMIPKRRIHLSELPYNMNGKIDRNKLKNSMEDM